MDEAIKQLEECLKKSMRNGSYWVGNDVFSIPSYALLYIIRSMNMRLEQVAKERDAIEDDFVRLANSLHSEFITYACEYCVENFPGHLCSVCEFKWRGVEVE